MDFYDVYDQNYIRIARREEKYCMTKIEVLDQTEFVLGEILDDIVLDSDNISITYNQGVQAKMSFSVVNEDGRYLPTEDSPFWYGRRIRVYKGLKDISNGDIYWFSKGVYVVVGVTSNDKTVEVSCVDKFGLFSSDCGASSLHTSSKIEAGHTVRNVYEKILSMDRGNGYPLDSKKPIIDYRTGLAEVNQDIEMGADTYLGDIMIELATTVKNRIYYDNSGRLRVTGAHEDVRFENKASVWEFGDEKTADLVNVSADYNFPDVKNRVTVWGENFDGQWFTSTAENNNPKSPVSVQKVGWRVAGTIEDMYGYEQENVDAFAEMYLTMKTIQGISVDVDCALIPHINVEDCVIVTHDKLKFDEKRFLVSEVNITGSKMTLSLVNIDNLPWHKEFS